MCIRDSFPPFFPARFSPFLATFTLPAGAAFAASDMLIRLIRTELWSLRFRSYLYEAKGSTQSLEQSTAMLIGQ